MSQGSSNFKPHNLRRKIQLGRNCLQLLDIITTQTAHNLHHELISQAGHETGGYPRSLAASYPLAAAKRCDRFIGLPRRPFRTKTL